MSDTWFFVMKCKSSLPNLPWWCWGGDEETRPTTSVTRDTDFPVCAGCLTESIFVSDTEGSVFARESFVTEKKRVLCSSAGDAVTGYHRLGGSNNKKTFSHISGG